MLEETSNCLAREGITDFKTIQSPAEDIPLADNSIDYIFVFNAIHHFNLREFMARAARVLKDGGVSSYTPACEARTPGISGAGTFPSSWRRKTVSTNWTNWKE